MKKFLASHVNDLEQPLALVFAGCGKDLQGLRLDISDVKVDYIVGETFTAANLKVFARYKDGETELADDEYEVDASAVDNTATGSYDVVVKFDGKTKSFKVNYYTKGTMTVASNSKYFIGQQFKDARPDVVYTSGKGDIMHLVDEYSVVSFNSEAAGEVTATLSYNGYQYETTVTVLEDEAYVDYIMGLIESNMASFDLNSVERVETANEVEDVKYYCYQYLYHGTETSQTWINLLGEVFTASGETYTKQTMQDMQTAAQSCGFEGMAYIDVANLNAYYATLVSAMVGEFSGLTGDEYELTIAQSYDTVTFTLVQGTNTYTLSINLVDYSISQYTMVTSTREMVETLNGAEYHTMPEPQGGWQEV